MPRKNPDKIDFDKVRPTELPTEGDRGFQALCGLVRHLGYSDPNKQLYNSDGSCVGDLLYFFNDNSGAIGAIYEWIEENYADKLDSMRGDEEEDDDDESSAE